MRRPERPTRTEELPSHHSLVITVVTTFPSWLLHHRFDFVTVDNLFDGRCCLPHVRFEFVALNRRLLNLLSQRDPLTRGASCAATPRWEGLIRWL